MSAKKSGVWSFCEQERGSGPNSKIIAGICKVKKNNGQICNKRILYSGSTGLIKHLATHNIDINAEVNPQSTIVSQPSILDHFSIVKEDSMSAVLARMISRDGIPFSTFTNSPDMRKLFKKSGFELPSSPNSIRKCVFDHAKDIKKKVMSEMQEALSKCEKLTLTFDEWSSLSNRKYLVLYVNAPHKSWNLGLTRIKKDRNLSKNERYGSLLYENITKLLDSFELKWDNFISIISDGASPNQIVASTAGISIQKCLAHAIQNAIKATLYSPDVISNSIVDLEEDSESEEEETEYETNLPESEFFRISTEPISTHAGKIPSFQMLNIKELTK